jgi:hypothetical protein
VTGDTSYSKNVKWVQTIEEIRNNFKFLEKSFSTSISNLQDQYMSDQFTSSYRKSMYEKEANMDTRGRTVSEICIIYPNGGQASSAINIHGVLSNGLNYDFNLENSGKNK